MWRDIAQVLPRPGPLWGACPMRPAAATGPLQRRPSAAQLLRSPLSQAARVAQDSAAQTRVWQGLDGAAREAALAALRRRLRRDGLTPPVLAQALGFVAGSAADVLGLAPRVTQRVAAAALLDQRLAEMAPGEGKTLALALAAAVGALAGIPVHVVTANEYLAARDAAALAPLYAALGLRVTALSASSDDATRRGAYAHDIVYATARELAFDFLRDGLAASGRPPAQRAAAAMTDAVGTLPLMRGLCMALLDEVDSILLDEAEVPLILSRRVTQAARRAFLWQALGLARQLRAGRDFSIQSSERRALLTVPGESRVAQLAAGLGGPWQRPRYRREAVALALGGLHAFHRDAHYVVRDGAVELIDEVTGRIASGRVWSRGLHTVVALKEGLVPPAETDTVAQTTFQRYFQRYWRVAGLSGTLHEARAELRDVIGAGVVRIPLHAPSRLHTLPPRMFMQPEARWHAVCERVVALTAAGRPVLIGTDSVADSQALSTHLQVAGIAHRVLNALHDAQEAAIVAAAGGGGQVTVSTRMAGRGTDIRLDAAAAEAGGLHVLSCQDNPSHRLDRQLAGRAARQGEAGSTEVWLLGRYSTRWTAAAAHKLAAWTTHSASAAWLAHGHQRWTQWWRERRSAACRAEVLRQDRLWDERRSAAGRPV